MSATVPETITGTWAFDPVHSSASFAVKHMVVSTFRATFKEIDATLELAGDDLRLTGTVPVASIDVDQPDFRGHLMSPEFFDAERTPNVAFVSTGVRRGDDGSVEVDGDLTVKGITRPVTAKGTITGPVTDAFGTDRVGIELETVVDRTAFELNWNAPLPKGGVAVANDVKLAVHLEFTRTEA
jgi:polyisoprenoid-binding protein YceI